jgi:hypothetical protein
VTLRLTSQVYATALMRSVQMKGGAAAVIAKGDPSAGNILIIYAEKGRVIGLRERILGQTGRYDWTSVGPQDVDNKDEIEKFLLRRRQFDPDIWIIELDVPEVERFVAEFDAVN